MKLGIDLDGVVCDFATPANEFLADFCECEPKPLDNWNWFTAYPNGVAAWGQMWEWFRITHAFAMLAPHNGAVETLGYLRERGHEIVFLTHRPYWAYRDTEAWLRRNGLDGGTKLVFVEDTESKAQQDVDLVLDDLPSTVAGCRAVGKVGLLFRRPWNTEAPPHMHDVKDWREVALKVDYFAVKVGALSA